MSRELRIVAILGMGLALTLGVINTASATLADRDATFGTEGGTHHPGLDSGSSTATAGDVLIDDQGRILTSNRCRDVTPWAICVVRFLSDGSIDAAFGTSGLTRVEFGADVATNYVIPLALDSQGRIVVASTCGSQMCVARLTSDGVVDASFGGGPVRHDPVEGLERIGAIHVDASDRVILGGTCGRFCLLRLATDGSVDESFGVDGLVLKPTDPVVNGESIVALFGEADGSLTAIGSCTINWPKVDLCGWRYGADGSPDLAFGVDGRVRLDLGGTTSISRAAGRTGDGGYLVLTSCPLGDDDTACVVKLDGDGSVDPDYGVAGSRRLSTTPNVGGTDMVVDAAGRAVVTWCYPLCITRLDAAGDLDLTFGGDGTVVETQRTEHAPRSSRSIAVDASGQPVINGDSCTIDRPLGFPCVGRWAAASTSEPYPPTNVVVVVGDRSLTVSWEAPVLDGGQPIVEYEASSSSAACSTSGTSCVITGLTNGVPTSVRVRARNAVGWSAPSDAIVVTPVGAPRAPVGVVVTAGDGQVAVEWSGASANGSPITGFQVDAGERGCQVGPSATGCVITGLTNWVARDVTVRANNAVGVGEPTVVEGVMPGLLPVAPGGVRVEGDGGVVATGDAIGTNPIGYDVQYREIAPLAAGLDPAIVGGTTVDIADEPHNVFLVGYRDDIAVSLCGGTLIDRRWVLTAAHCLRTDLGLLDDVIVVHSATDWTEVAAQSEYLAASSRLYTHPSYDPLSFSYDVGLILLRQSITDSTAFPAPIFDGAVGDDMGGRVTGWGLTSTDGVGSDELQGVDATVDAACEFWRGFGDFVAEVSICVDTHPTGICDGDSGSPLVVDDGGVTMVAGIASFRSSEGCAAPAEIPDVFARVGAPSVLEWIEGRTGPLWSTESIETAETTMSTSLDGLEPGRRYAVRVRTRSAVGSGPWTTVAVTMPGSIAPPTDPPPTDPPPTGGGDPIVLPPSDGGPSPGLCDGSNAHPFVDVSEHSFAFDSVGCIYGLGITTGTSATTYSPADPVTRAQMAAFIERLYRVVVDGPCDGGHPFTDVSATSFAYASVGCIFTLGVTTGTSPTSYSPNQTVTREQMASFVARVYRLVTGEPCGSVPSFVDVLPTSFALRDIGCIADLGITNGTSPTTYSPGDPVTREQMAAFIERLYTSLTR